MESLNNDKHNIRDILVANGSFTPSTLDALTKKIDMLIKVEYMKMQNEDG